MITDISELRKFIKNIITDYSPKNGWLEIYQKTENNNFDKYVRSFIADSKYIDWEQPFSDTGGTYNYPTMPVGESLARVVVVEINNAVDGSYVSSELNQTLRIDMNLIEEKENNKIIYSKVNSDKSTKKSITKINDMFSAKWLDLNEVCENEECLVVCFYIVFKCDSQVIDKLNDDVMKIIRFPRLNLIYERTVRKNDSLVRVIGKKIFKKKYFSEIIRPIFNIGYNEDGSTKYYLIDKYINAQNGYQLTPVYFDRRVLTKYEQSQYFDVDAMKLSCSNWSLQIFNNRVDRISVLLQHLITSLPADEYKHWMSYNVSPDPFESPVTRGEYDTASRGIPHFPDRNDHRFKWFLRHYFKQCSENKITPILKPLNSIDKPYFNILNLISENSQWHFDLQILSLSKILIESINMDELKNKGCENEKSKNRLKEYINKFQGKDIFDYAGFLDNLYLIRLGAAHRRRKSEKDSDYHKGINYFEAKYGHDLVDLLDGIFKEACELINVITKIDGMETYGDIHKNIVNNSNRD